MLHMCILTSGTGPEICKILRHLLEEEGLEV